MSEPLVTPAQATQIAIDTEDAYSFETYGFTAWEAACKMLAGRGYDAKQIEAIMRSKWARWAADGRAGKHPTHHDLERFLDEPRNNATHAEVVKLTAETFNDA